MTKETKIGLLVGLAFIILFAIILSEKGATRGTSAPSGLTLADAAARGSRAVEARKPLEKAGRLPVENLLPKGEPSLPVLADADGRHTLGLPTADPDAKPALLPESVVAKLNQPLPGDSPAGAHLDESEQATVSLEDALAAALEKEEAREADQSNDTAGPRFLPRSSALAEETLVSSIEDEFPESAARYAPAGSAAAPPQAKQATSIRAVHTVAAGENLGKIAARYYGRSTPARIEAIFNANRDVLSDIHMVRAEDELKIPALAVDQDDDLFEATPDFAPARIVSAQSRRLEPGVLIPVPVGEGVLSDEQTRPTRADDRREDRATKSQPKANFQWYEIRKNDSLSSIARHELGNEKRFLELFRMNRDLIENRNAIRPGMKIRLPVHEAATTTPVVVVSSGDAEADVP